MTDYMDTAHYRVNKFTAAARVTSITDPVMRVCGIPLSLDDLEEVIRESAERGRLLSEVTTERDAINARIAERNKTDPIWRMHNLCDAMEADRKDSPYSQEAWEQQDEAYQEKCREMKRVEVYAEAMRKALEEIAGKDPYAIDAPGILRPHWERIARAALATNPSPSGLSNEAPVRTNAEASGPVGLGPRCTCAAEWNPKCPTHSTPSTESRPTDSSFSSFRAIGNTVQHFQYWIATFSTDLMAQQYAAQRNEAAAQRVPPSQEANPWKALAERMEFGVWRNTGGKEGEMCGACYRFKREGHALDCSLAKQFAKARSMERNSL